MQVIEMQFRKTIDRLVFLLVFMVVMVNYSEVNPVNYTLSHQEPAQYIYFNMDRILFYSVVLVLVLVLVGLVWWLGGYGALIGCILVAGLVQ